MIKKAVVKAVWFFAGFIAGMLLILSLEAPGCRPVVAGLPLDMTGWGFILWALMMFVLTAAMIALGLLALAAIIASIISLLKRQPLKKVFAALISFRWQDLEVRKSEYHDRNLK